MKTFKEYFLTELFNTEPEINMRKWYTHDTSHRGMRAEQVQYHTKNYLYVATVFEHPEDPETRKLNAVEALIQFQDSKGRTHVTGKGKPYEAFNTAIAFIKKVIEIYDPYKISFVAKTTQENEKEEESPVRAQIYERLVSKLGRQFGYRTAYKIDTFDTMDFSLVKDRIYSQHLPGDRISLKK